VHYTLDVPVDPSTVPVNTCADWRRKMLIAAGIFVVMLALEVVVLATSVGLVPNTFSLPLFEQWPLLSTLWSSNRTAAFSVATHQALLVVEHRSATTGSQVWGIYYFPFTLAARFFIAWAVATFVVRLPIFARWQVHAMVLGTALLGLSIAYFRLASCCSVAPRWGLDIVLLTRALDPSATLIDWQPIYRWLEPLLPATQVVMGVGGAALLLYATMRRHLAAPRHDNVHPLG
jgi:hypothetical protein